MPNKNEQRRDYDESFKLAAVEYLQRTGGSVEEAAAELGIPSAELRSWSKKTATLPRTAKSLTGIARLKAENEAPAQRDSPPAGTMGYIETTLGVLSTTVGRNGIS